MRLALSLCLAGAALTGVLACQPTARRGPSGSPTPSLPVEVPAAAPVVAARPTRSVDSSPLTPPVVVRVGLLNATADAGIYIAQEKGYFREEGIELETTLYPSGVTMVPALTSGQLDVGGGELSAALVFAVSRDIPIKIVADKGSTPPGFGFQALVLRKDLIDTGRVRGCPSLRLLKVAVTAAGVTAQPALDRFLRDCDLVINDLAIAAMSLSDMTGALRNGTIDGAMMVEPILTNAVSEGIAVIYKRTDELYPSQQVAVLLYSPRFIASQRPAANRFMVAYLRGVRDHYDAFTRGKNKEDIVELLARATGVGDAALYERMAPPGLNPDGYVNLRGINDDIEWWSTHGYLGRRIDAAQLVDNSFVDYAIDRLGSYVPR